MNKVYIIGVRNANIFFSYTNFYKNIYFILDLFVTDERKIFMHI